METIIDCLVERAKTHANKIAFTFIDDKSEATHISYQELHSSAQAIANSLKNIATPGDAIVLLLPQGLDYIKSFLGCLYAGIVAVPLYPPKNAKHSDRVLNVIENCRAVAALTTIEAQDFITEILAPLPVFAVNTLLLPKKLSEIPKPESDTLAFLQYTSGSTGHPKGVMVSHTNIVANLSSLQEATHCSSQDTFCNWLPLFHDLGLVNTLLLPIYLGAHSVLMSPARFIRRPLNWLEAISHYKASICGAPNFAFDHCISRIKADQLAHLDLSSWRIAFNAAEPIDPDTLIQFATTFEPAGFKKSALYPSYGMAEATVFIAGSEPGHHIIQGFDTENLQNGKAVPSNHAKATHLVASGKSQSFHSIKIVNPDSLTPLADNEIGEIWFAGKSVAQGYWGDADKTRATFGLRLPHDENAYLRTGDLGFCHNGYVYIAGRIKDILILKGRNYYPQDIEKMAHASVEGLQAGGAAAFEVNGQALLMLEVEPRAIKTFPFESACKIIAAKIFDYFDILLADIVFVRAGSLSKTSSGKIQRSRAQADYQQNRFDILTRFTEFTKSAEYEAPQTATELYLANLWEELLQQPVGLQDNFFQLGGQSLTATRVISSINQNYSLSLSMGILFTQDSLQSLANFIDAQRSKATAATAKIAPSRKMHVSDSQRSLWFIHQFEGSSPQYNIASLVSISGSLHLDALNNAFNAIIRRHKILRSCYSEHSGELESRVLEQWEFKLVPITKAEADIQPLLESHIKLPFDLTRDLMVRAQLFKVSDTEHQLLTCFHHIAIDGFSLQIIEEELSQLYEQFVNNNTHQPTIPSLQFNDYVGHIQQTDNTDEKSFHYWKSHLTAIPTLHSLELDYPRPQKQILDGDCIFSTLDTQLLQKLKVLAKQEKVSLYHVLQTAFACLLHRYSGQSDILMGSPYANRDKVCTQDMIGYFVNPLVLRTPVYGQESFIEQLKLNSRIIQEAITHNKLSFLDLIGILNPERSLSHHPVFQIMFTFNEARKSGIKLKDTVVSQKETPRFFSRFDLTLEITERSGLLELAWEFATSLFSKSTISQLGEHFVQLLQSIVTNPGTPVHQLKLLSDDEHKALLAIGYNISNVQNSYASIHERFEQQVIALPHAVAVSIGEQQLSYTQLNEQANQLAHHLIASGINPGDLVGLCIERDMDMLVALFAILKAGAAYVPLDPGYPLERLDYMLSHAKPAAVIGTRETLAILAAENIQQINLDIENVSTFPATNPHLKNFSSNALAYVIYTSGSTGRPKGVKIQHDNVLNFFLGLDERFIKNQRQNHWLAVTSICFDISVLELFWTLCRGDCITLQPDRPSRQTVEAIKPMEFGLFYFAANSEVQADKFHLMLSGAKFADQHGLHSIWLPERHFNIFGGQFSNPAVAAAAVAVVTERVRIQSGSVVLPLHDPIRVAEEWAMVDNLSNGRVGLSIAPGWQPNDFALAPDAYQNRHQVMKDKLAQLQNLWQGKSISRINGMGQHCEINIHPKPVQQHLPISITAAGNIEAFKYAGSIGANVLTHLLGQSLSELTEKITAYRLSLAEHGFNPDQGKVTLMLHTFMHEDEHYVRQQVEIPFKQYLAESITLVQPIADQFGLDLQDDEALIIEHAFHRYFDTAGLFGTPQQCLYKLTRIQQAGIDDIACLIDFGIENETVLNNLPSIIKLQQLLQRKQAQQALLNQRFQHEWNPDHLILHNAITHMQSTPSLARELSEAALEQLDSLLLGGEALPEEFAQRLASYPNLSVFNLYGPTETTVWTSIKHHVPGDKVLLAGPMANTQFIVLDENLGLVPKGVAGELYIAGANVSAGYLHNIQLTAERFIRNPFTNENIFSRLYKTGDQVKWVGEGDCLALQYLGRIDQQVKINGFRIELGEIESQLNKSPHVRQSVVISRENQLFAYVIGQEDFLADIKQSLSHSLPDYMNPAHYLFLKEFPLTPNGKIDRNAMPQIKVLKKAVRQPENPIEAVIYQIWQKNLPNTEFGADDDFFSLGGNSLLAIKIISEINNHLDSDLVVKELFSAPSISELGKIVETKQLIKITMSEYDEKDLEEVTW